MREKRFTCAAALREEQVFIQALSLASTEEGVYRVMSGVHTEGRTAPPTPPEPQPGTPPPVAPMSGFIG